MATTTAKRIYLRIFKPRGRRAYEETFDDPEAANAREASLRAWGYLVTRTEREIKVPLAKQPKAKRERVAKLRAKQESVRKAISAKRSAERWAAIEAHGAKLQADGKIDAKAAMRRARKLWPKGEIRCEVSTRHATIEPVCRIDVGRVECIGDLAAYFLIEHRIEAPTFEDALADLAAKVNA